MRGRNFRYGFALGVALGGAALAAVFVWTARIKPRKLAAKSSVGSGPFIDKKDRGIGDWTLCEESKSEAHELENERPNVTDQSQRW